MDSVSMNHYEKQLYSVFKSFDVDNEEALDRPAVLELCDALQLEDRGASLVDTLFERRASRVTFSQFRNGLLSVLGGEPPSQTTSTVTPPSPLSCQTVATTPPQSDDDSSGREVAPKFTFGSKKYGRRSRPPRVDHKQSPRHRVASESRLDGERTKQRMKCKRSSSAMETRAESLPDDDVLDLDHDQRVDRERALKLCQGLRMHGVDRRFVEMVFEETKTDEMTVGEFFDRLNTSLQSSIQASLDGSVSEDCVASDVDVISSDVIVEAWERAGVQKPRRLLLELGFTVIAIRPRDLERALEDELQALGTSQNVSEPRSLLLLAANTLARLRVDSYRRKLDVAIAERDKLRSDLVEANRRARLLAQDVDENHARIEAELKASLRQVEARHAEAARASAAEAAAERERAAVVRQELESELSRRADAETRLRADLAACRDRNQELEERIRDTETRADQAERDCSRLISEARAAAERDAELAERERTAVAELNARLQELRGENQQLRDRNDELAAAAEAATRAQPGAAAALPASWRDETDDHSPLLASPSRSQRDSLTIPEDEVNKIKKDNYILQMILAKFNGMSQELGKCERCSALSETIASLNSQEAASTEASVQTEASKEDITELKKEIIVLKASHELETGNLNNIIKDLECSLEQLREEYDKCEEYWARKLEEERELFAEEQRAGDERLRALSDEIARYERQFAAALPALPALHESALEDQYLRLDAELADLRAAADAERARKDEEISKQKRHIEELERRVVEMEQQQQQQQRRLLQQRQQRADARICTDVDVQHMQTASALRARAARAERAAQRLHARLAAADLLVKDLYIENCRLAHLPHAPHVPHVPLPHAHVPHAPHAHAPHAPRLP